MSVLEPPFQPLEMPFWVPKGTLESLAEQIAVAVIGGARDPNGLRIRAPLNMAALPDVAREAMRQATGATHVVVEGESDPDLGPNSKIIRRSDISTDGDA